MFYIYHTLSYSSVFPYTTLYRSLRDAAPAPRVEATLTRTDVVAARRDRGARWAAVRELWLYEKATDRADRSEEHTSELQSRGHLVCRLLLEKKKEILILADK